MKSNCCNSDMIEPLPDDELEELGSLWRAYACYICKECGKSCEPNNLNIVK